MQSAADFRAGTEALPLAARRLDDTLVTRPASYVKAGSRLRLPSVLLLDTCHSLAYLLAIAHCQSSAAPGRVNAIA